ncbi:unnamed protein product [Hapterophycus canaliculatus]
MISLGDSLSNQQGDSLVGMLGWNPAWMPKGGPRNNKKARRWRERITRAQRGREDGMEHFTLVGCWHTQEDRIRGIERCYDQFSNDFPPPHEASYNSGKVKSAPSFSTNKQVSNASGRRATLTAVTAPEPIGNRNIRKRRNARRALDEGEEEGGDREEEKRYHDGERQGGDEVRDGDEDAISVHIRMVSRPLGGDWFDRAVRDYNETRASDVIVVNFGAHYRATPQGDEDFRQDVFPILDGMAKLGEKATVVWREMSPVHFPSQNGSFDTFVDLNIGRTACCTSGTPPKWVDDYIREHGLSDRIKVLRIYDMSVPRGAAHHTCHVAPPSSMDQTGVSADNCYAKHGVDCTHWSETGVVEEWNALLLNHICPVD